MRLPVRTRLTSVALLAASLAACSSSSTGIHMFHGPIDVSIVGPNEIFDVPVGFVSNSRSGDIVMVDLKHGSYLRDNPLGSWIRAEPLPTGADRLIEQVAVASEHVAGSSSDSPASDWVTLFVSDNSRSQLLVVPYLDSQVTVGPNCVAYGTAAVPADGQWIPRRPVCIPEFEGKLSDSQTLLDATMPVQSPDLDAQGNATGYHDSVATVTGFNLRHGHTTTETWSATWDSNLKHFLVSGSRAGLQERTALLNQPYFSDHNEVEFTVEAPEGIDLDEGSRFTFHTDSGIQEIDLPDKGVIEDIRLAPSECTPDVPCRLYASVQGESGQGYLLTMDLSPLETRSDAFDPQLIPVCPDGSAGPCQSQPMRMDLDDYHQRLFMAEASDAGGVYQIDLTDDSVSVLPYFEPNFDVAYVEQLEDDTLDVPAYQHLLVASLAPGEVWLYDLVGQKMMDVNGYTAAIDPVRLYTPVLGLTSSKVPVSLFERNDDNVPVQSILVGATTFQGNLQAIRGENGCLPFASSAGALVDTSYVAGLNDLGATSNPHLAVDAVGGKVATLSPCGGISRTETWTFTYDESLQGYKVHGSLTNQPGEYQQNIAYEDERYVSDQGEISVLIVSGTLPTTEGDSLAIPVTGNVVPISVGELPADPGLYTQTYGDRNDVWTPIKFRTVGVGIATDSDTLYMVDLAKPGTYATVHNPLQ